MPVTYVTEVRISVDVQHRVEPLLSLVFVPSPASPRCTVVGKHDYRIDHNRTVLPPTEKQATSLTRIGPPSGTVNSFGC